MCCILFQFYSNIYFHHMLACYMRVHLSFYSYTLIGSSDSLNLYIQVYVFYLPDQVFEEDHTLYEKLELSYLIVLSWYSLVFLYSYCFHDSLHWTHVCSISLFICYHVWTSICVITVILIHHSDYIACPSYFRLSVYTWGILLTYVRRRLSSRLRFYVL